MAVADLGSMAVFTDPTGAAIGVWQPGTHKGFGVVAEPGAPAWFELHTRDYDAAIPFYTEVLGWQTEPMPDSGDMRYATKTGPAGPEAGVYDAAGDLPAGVPSHWVVYFAVDDTDAAVALTEAEGGAVLMAPEDTPFGRMAAVTDPNGALLRLTGPNTQS
jgi:predicted enzyme related to lactoylglutathione lyase